MQGSAQWHADRDSRVVRGSEASLCLNLMPDSQAHYEQRRTPIPAYLADHGKAREPEALRYVRCLLPDECVWTCGFCPLPEDPERVGASPDALTLNAVVEIKAPYHLRYDTAYCWPCIPVERVVQLELEMRCTRRTHTYYVLYFRRDDEHTPRVLVFLYERNDALWCEFIAPRLRLFIEARATGWSWDAFRAVAGPRALCRRLAAAYSRPAHLIHASHHLDPQAVGSWTASEPDAVERAVLARNETSHTCT